MVTFNLYTQPYPRHHFRSHEVDTDFSQTSNLCTRSGHRIFTLSSILLTREHRHLSCPHEVDTVWSHFHQCYYHAKSVRNRSQNKKMRVSEGTREKAHPSETLIFTGKISPSPSTLRQSPRNEQFLEINLYSSYPDMESVLTTALRAFS